jgi:ABC-type bacteriocin/lantibiotic exporter with double-glycine peptidase domain
MPPAFKEFVKHSVGIVKEVVATERIQEYIETESEAAWTTTDNRPPYAWPVSGNVKIIDYSTRYRENLDLVLSKINIEFRAGHKVS